MFHFVLFCMQKTDCDFLDFFFFFLKQLAE